jgi:16S rRNA (guanine966-N2)-methyltransferase
MRIIGGQARGRTVCLPGGCRIRPTADRVKKSLFDILHPVTGKTFLDLFAGSGNVGLESLSRGALYAVFVERDPRLVEAIQKNLAQLAYCARAEVIAADAERGIGRLVQKRRRFDLVFADPPYDEGLTVSTLKWLEKGDLLAENGIVILQHSIRETPEGSKIRTLAVTDQRRYGDTVLSFLKGADFKSVPKWADSRWKDSRAPRDGGL